MRKLFIYYSLTGNGDKLASYLSNKEFDIRKLEVSKPLPKNFFLSIVVGGYKAMIDYKEKLTNFDNNLDNYDEIYIGSPIWNSRLCTPVSTALKELDLSNKKITFILYSGSGKPNKAELLLKQIYPNSKIINLKSPLDNLEKIDELL